MPRLICQRRFEHHLVEGNEPCESTPRLKRWSRVERGAHPERRDGWSNVARLVDGMAPRSASSPMSGLDLYRWPPEAQMGSY